MFHFQFFDKTKIEKYNNCQIIYIILINKQ